MTKYYIYDKDTGAFNMIIESPTPPVLASGQDYHLIPPATDIDYLDEKGIWVTPPPSPHPYYLFNYHQKVWELRANMEDMKHQTWERIKIEKQTILDRGFPVGLYLFDLSLESLTQMSLFLNSTDPVRWTLKNNESVLLSSDDLKYFLNILNGYRNDLHLKTQKIRVKIQKAETVFDLDSLTLY